MIKANLLVAFSMSAIHILLLVISLFLFKNNLTLLIAACISLLTLLALWIRLFKAAYKEYKTSRSE